MNTVNETISLRQTGIQKQKPTFKLSHLSQVKHQVPTLSEMSVEQIDKMLDEAIAQADRGETYTTKEVWQSLEEEIGLRV